MGSRWPDSSVWLRFYQDAEIHSSSIFHGRSLAPRWFFMSFFIFRFVCLVMRRLICLFDEGCSKLIEREETMPGEIPMFRTGLGRSVPLKESSIAKAKSILADDTVDYSGTLSYRRFLTTWALPGWFFFNRCCNTRNMKMFLENLWFSTSLVRVISWMWFRWTPMVLIPLEFCADNSIQPAIC